MLSQKGVVEMKTLLITLLFTATTAFAAQVDLAWEPSPSNPTGYVLYYGQTPENFEFKKDVGSVLTTSLDGLGVGDWYFAVTAYNETMESDFSNVVSYTETGFTVEENVHVPVTKPATVNITIEVK